MDPEVALANARAALLRLDELSERNDLYAQLRVEALQEVAEAFMDLDEWLTKGGFLPKDWRKRNLT